MHTALNGDHIELIPKEKQLKKSLMRSEYQFA